MVSDSRHETEGNGRRNPHSDALKFVYNFKCQKCRYSRKTGHGKLTAETLATSHALRMAHHVIVWESNLQTLESRICLEIEPDKSPNLLDEPPF